MKKFLMLIAAVLPLACAQPTVRDLRCEGMDEPLGIATATPRFSWKNDICEAQSAYCIEVASSPELLKSGKADLWSSGKVESDEQVMVPYGGGMLEAKQLCWWRVRTWSASGKASAWSKPQRFSVGALEGLQGDYIGAVPGEGRSALLKTDFEAPCKGTYFLHISTLGYHEACINGEKVSDAVLTPAVSQLDKRALIMTYDVSSLVRKGSNSIVLHTGSGWYKKIFDAAYDGALVKAELDLLKDGQWQPVAVTDGKWQGRWSGYSDTGIWTDWHFGGEIIDAAAIAGTSSEEGWGPVDVFNPEGIAETPQTCEPCIVQETLEAVEVRQLGDSLWLADFGKVVNAMSEIHLPQLPAGTKVCAYYNDNPGDNRDERFSDVLISSGAEGGDTFCSKFNYHVFQTVVLEGLPEAPAPADIKAHRMRTDYAPTASFRCSDDDLNAIYEMVSYTMENLAYDGDMVDCASLERLGYGGDGNASTLSLQTIFDVGPLYYNWLQAWKDVIREDGGLPHTAPSPYRAGGGPYWNSFIVQAPWRTYMDYGDDGLLRSCYDTMKQWLKYVDAYTVDGLLKRWPNTEYRGWYLGDWLAPKEMVDVMDTESVDLVSNCVMSQTYADLVQIADRIGKEKDIAEFESRLKATNELIFKTFYHPETGLMGTGSQIDMIYPLLVGAVPEEMVAQIKETLKKRTAELYHGHLAVGLVGVPVLAEWAAREGEADFVYGMLKQPGYPGYLNMISNGATGTWESWDGDRSRFHNCYNGIGSWFYQALGGIIADEPGYRHVTINPQRPEGLEWVKVTKETPYGTIRVEWDSKSMDVWIPSGVTATCLGSEIGAGKYHFEVNF